MNIFLINWDYNDKISLEVAGRLEAKGHKIAYWSGAGYTNVLASSRQKFAQTIFHSHRDAIFCRPAEEFKDTQFAPPSEEVIKNLYEAESILSTLKQFEKLKMSGLEKKNLYHRYLEYWLGVINKLKPEVIIFTLCPHTGYDFIIYSLAKLLKIKTIMFEYMRIADRHLLINDFVIGSPSLKKEIENNRGKQSKIDDLSQDIKEYYENQINKANDVISFDFKAFKNKYSGLNLLLIKLKMIMASIFDLSIFKKTRLFFLKKIGPNFKKEYIKLNNQADFNKKFIYVALHYQPELATAPLGGIFVDQILMIKILAAAIPDDWVIYVKEHPVQWLSQGLNYTNFRYPGYYEAIARINKVKLITAETAATELIEKSRAVATVTGTAGWESLLRQKPAIIFGCPPYRDCAGVFIVNDIASCRAALAKINSGFTINQQEIISYLISLDKISIHVFFENIIEKLSKLSPEEHVDNLVKAITEDIENNS